METVSNERETLCAGPLGFPMREAAARAVEALMKDRPAGREWEYRRVFAAGVAAEMAPAERCEVSVVSSAAVDRDGEVVLPEGVDLATFRQNPVVTFAHRYDQLPVGRALWIKRDGDRLKAKTRYAPRPADWSGDWLPDAVWHMVQGGDLRGKSIGFLPVAGGPPTAEELAARPAWRGAAWVHRRVLLLEYAVAPVQSNPEALVEAVGKGVLSPTLAAALGLAPSHAGELPFAELAASFPARLAAELAERRLPQRVAELAAERLARRLGRV